MAVIGGGAAGLAAAIFTARQAPDRRIVVLDGAKKLGAKILVAGGGRCNVTNRVVTPEDFCGGSRHIIRRVLAALTVEQTTAFFREMGVELVAEEHGKLFPTTNKARTVLDALLGEADRRGVSVYSSHRVTELRRHDDGFHIATTAGMLRADRVVLATGGRSLPKTGSDGEGYRFAQELGHSLVPVTPALAPFVLANDFHRPLSGIAHDVVITVRAAGVKAVHVRGAMLWTHFGVSGPAVLDISRHWHRARHDGRDVEVAVNLMPGQDFNTTERQLLELADAKPKTLVRKALARRLPARVAAAVLNQLAIDGDTLMTHLRKDQRRKLVGGLTAWPLPVRDSRGYAHAEVTAGGVPLSEIDARTMASRTCPGLFLVGEILDVDGRIGGFNFQWAWSSARAASTGLVGSLAASTTA